MGADYIPEANTKAAVWMKIFARVLLENHSACFVSIDEAMMIDELVLAYRQANAQTWIPESRTGVKVQARVAARKAAEKFVRPMAQRLRTDPRIPTSMKAELGLRVGTKRRREIPMPEGVPTLRVSLGAGGSLKLVAFDSLSPNRRARPKGASELQLFERIIRAAPVNREESTDETIQLDSTSELDASWRLVGQFTRIPIEIHPEIHNTGDEVQLVARWISTRGKSGRFGNVVSQKMTKPTVVGMRNREMRFAA